MKARKRSGRDVAVGSGFRVLVEMFCAEFGVVSTTTSSCVTHFSQSAQLDLSNKVEERTEVKYDDDFHEYRHYCQRQQQLLSSVVKVMAQVGGF